MYRYCTVHIKITKGLSHKIQQGPQWEIIRENKSRILRGILEYKLERGWSRKWIFLLTRKSTFLHKYFYLRVITRNYA
jgi:hypothetical protein